MKRCWLLQGLAATALLMVAGCADQSKWTPPAGEPQPESKVVRDAKNFHAPSAAGVALGSPAPGGQLWTQLLSSRAFSSRPDPFALEPRERSFEQQQTMERVFGDIGQWHSPDFTPKVEVIPTPEVEPQPYRRLAGVIVGDSILALIDMGDGRLQLIRPGQDIDGWHVDSINGEEAVLSRAGNKLPHQVTVRLEEPRPGAGGGGGVGGGAPGGPGRPGGGPTAPGSPGRPGSAPGAAGGGD